MGKRIAKLTRVRNSGDGGPVYEVEFEDGDVARTVADGQIGHYAENSEWQGIDLDVEFADGRIHSWKAAS